MSASPGESRTPRARKAWTGEDDESRGERKDATANAGFLAKYTRWSHDRPCLVFTSVFMAIIAISAVVALANLAEFNTDAGDKVRPPLSRRDARKSSTRKICRPVFVFRALRLFRPTRIRFRTLFFFPSDAPPSAPPIRLDE